MHRREFLLSTMALGAAGLKLPCCAIDPIARKGGPILKLSIAAYSYRDYLTGKMKPNMTLDDFVDLSAEMGLPAVELTSYYFKDTSTNYLSKLKGRCSRLGLDISGGAVGNKFTEPDPAKLKEEIRKTKEWTERYSLLGAKTMRIFAGNAVQDEAEEITRQRCMEAILEVCDHASQFGVYMALENHGGIVTTADQILKIVKAIKHDWFGVNLDSGNFRSGDPYEEFAKLAPYAVTVQIKTEVQYAGKKKEEADLARVIKILKDANYQGYVALEYEAPAEPMKAIPGHIKTLKTLCAG
ncbi:MAG TPA: sugar phosphate isomerase/epimerase family protein [Gemmatales bacterium]|nr:sugar phosphate isomerase/epimerase family protein [Gemmatales bacterium]